MISMKTVAVVAILALAGESVAQEQADRQRIADLIEQLGVEGTKNAAAEQLVALGDLAAEQLLDTLLEDESQRAEVLQVLARMRGQADLIVAELMAPRELPPELHPLIYRALGDLAPYASVDLGQAQWFLSARLLMAATPEVKAKIYNGILRLVARASSPIRAGSGISDLVAVLENGTADERVLAAELLGYQGHRAQAALPALRRTLLTSHPPAAREGLGRSKLRVSIDQEIHSAAAQAMEEIAPGDPVIAMAVAFRLVNDVNVDQRVDAAIVLGRFAADAEGVVPRLLQALEDAEPKVVAEAITALGMIGPAAKNAIPTLENLTEHDDPQIAQRARAALRQIRGYGK